MDDQALGPASLLRVLIHYDRRLLPLPFCFHHDNASEKRDAFILEIFHPGKLFLNYTYQSNY